MEEKYKNERVKDLKTITERHVSREIEGCTSWRHFAVHQDRGWLLSALKKIQEQVEKVRNSSGNTDAEQAFEEEVRKLLDMLEESRLNHLGDEAE